MLCNKKVVKLKKLCNPQKKIMQFSKKTQIILMGGGSVKCKYTFPPTHVCACAMAYCVTDPELVEQKLISGSILDIHPNALVLYYLGGLDDRGRVKRQDKCSLLSRETRNNVENTIHDNLEYFTQFVEISDEVVAIMTKRVKSRRNNDRRYKKTKRIKSTRTVEMSDDASSGCDDDSNIEIDYEKADLSVYFMYYCQDPMIDDDYNSESFSKIVSAWNEKLASL